MNGNIRNSKKAGYTLIEIIVVLALIGIVLTVAIPSVNLIFNTSEKRELMEFKRDIIVARNRAVMENRIYILMINIQENRYLITQDHSLNHTIRDKKFSQGISFKSNNIDNSIMFYPTGSPNKGGTIRLTNRNKQDIQISVYAQKVDLLLRLLPLVMEEII